MSKILSKVELVGSKEGGWVIRVSDNVGFKGDFAITQDEGLKLHKLLTKKVCPLTHKKS